MRNKRSFLNILLVITSVLNWFILWNNSFFSCSSHNTKILQNWGNYADMSQGVVIYVIYTSDVLLFCWFGTQLTQHVRDNYIFYSKDVMYIMRRAINGLGNQTGIKQSLHFVFYLDFRSENLSKIRDRFKCISWHFMDVNQAKSQFGSTLLRIPYYLIWLRCTFLPRNKNRNFKHC